MSRFPTVSKNYDPFRTLHKRDNFSNFNNYDGCRRYNSVELLNKNKSMDSYNRRYHKMNKRSATADNKQVLKAVCILIVNDKKEFLSVSHKTHFDDINLPGGKVDWEDKTDMDGAIRELKEETGLTIIRENMKMIYRNYDIGNSQTFHVKTYYAKKYTGTIYTDETGKVEWLPLETLRTGSKHWNVYNGIILDKYYELMKNKK